MKKRLLSALLSGALLGTLFLGGCGSGETQLQRALLFRRARGKPIEEMMFQNR